MKEEGVKAVITVSEGREMNKTTFSPTKYKVLYTAAGWKNIAFINVTVCLVFALSNTFKITWDCNTECIVHFVIYLLVISASDYDVLHLPGSQSYVLWKWDSKASVIANLKQQAFALEKSKNLHSKWQTLCFWREKLVENVQIQKWKLHIRFWQWRKSWTKQCIYDWYSRLLKAVHTCTGVLTYSGWLGWSWVDLCWELCEVIMHQ